MPRPVPATQLLDPASLAALDDLQILARTVVEGYLSGHHLLPQAGFGVEFAQYRSYDPGDDLRRIDWKVYGRTDRLYVRQAEVERDVTVRFVLDATGSMGHRDGELTKLDHARMLVAAIGYLANRQGDRLALHIVTRGGAIDLPPVRQRPLDRFFHALEQVAPEGRWPPFDELQGHLLVTRARELVVLVSDFYDDEGEIDALVRSLRALGHEVMALQVMARNELELDWEGDVEFVDLETGEAVGGDTATLRGPYRDRLQAELDRWRRRMLELEVAHALVTTDTPFASAIREFLLHREELPS